MAAKKITVKLKRGMAGTRDWEKANVRGLGLRKPGHTSTLENKPAVRGMIKKVIHLVDVVEEK